MKSPTIQRLDEKVRYIDEDGSVKKVINDNGLFFFQLIVFKIIYVRLISVFQEVVLDLYRLSRA